MATNPVNLVDAVATVMPRMARNRSAVLRFGVVKALPVNALVTVTISGVDVSAPYLASYMPYVGDYVSLINDGDKWFILGRVAVSSDVGGGRVLGYSEQVTQPPFDATGTYVDFSSAAFPYVTFTVPRSGRVLIHASAYLQNINTATSTCYFSQRISGTGAPATVSHQALMVRGTAMRATKTMIWTGGTAGAAVTLIPQWYISSGDSATASFTEGVLMVQVWG